MPYGQWLASRGMLLFVAHVGALLNRGSFWIALRGHCTWGASRVRGMRGILGSGKRMDVSTGTLAEASVSPVHYLQLYPAAATLRAFRAFGER